MVTPSSLLLLVAAGLALGLGPGVPAHAAEALGSSVRSRIPLPPATGARRLTRRVVPRAAGPARGSWSAGSPAADPRAWTTPPYEEHVEAAPRWLSDYLQPRTAADCASLLGGAGLATGCTLLLASGDLDAVSCSTDIGQVVLPGAAFAVPLLDGDPHAAAEYGVILGAALGLTELGKLTLGKDRPNGADARSFPSAHTAAAFSAAAFLQSRYGARAGLPAYVLALHTGIGRVVGDAHFLDDVIAGAGVGIVTAGLFDKLFARDRKTRKATRRRSGVRYEFAFGGILSTENDITYPEESGTSFDLSTFEGGDDTRPTARFSLYWKPDARHELMVRLDPVELRGSTTLTAPLQFGGSSFLAGEHVSGRWRGAEYKLRWRYELLPRARRLSLRAGVTGLLASHLVGLESAVRRDSVESVRFLALPHARLAYRLRPDLLASLSVDGIPAVDALGFDVEAALRYEFWRGWDVGLRVRWSQRFMDNDVDNDPAIHAFYLTIGRSL